MRLAAALGPVIAVVALASCVTPAPTASTSNEPRDESYSLACLSVPQPECEAIAAEGVRRTTVPGDIVAITVQAFGCEGVACPPGFGVRSRGEVWVELAGPSRIQEIAIEAVAGGLNFAVGADASIAILDAHSAPVGAPVAPFALGHCGLLSPIDADGSLWDPIGQIDGDASDAINSSSGTITFLAPRAARFLTDSGFRADLVRRAGAKSYPLCA